MCPWVLLVLIAGSWGIITVHQSPPVLSVQLGDTVQILCRASQDIGNDMALYHFKPGQAPKTLYDGNQRYLCTPGRFSDSYTGHYCQHSETFPSTQTKLIVKSRATAAPQVSVFAPTGKDLTRTGGQTTLLCLINNFYPDQVTVSWTMDGKGVSGDQQDSQSVRAQAHAQASLLLYPAPPRSLERSKSASHRHLQSNVDKVPLTHPQRF
uniref:Ig-like domain-containing protein n=1 Tax=Hucho hucho TaxID=62062 RepID=A0A4W5QD03_9TELE